MTSDVLYGQLMGSTRMFAGQQTETPMHTSETYNMSHRKRGYAIILLDSHEEISNSSVNENEMLDVIRWLGFDVQIWNNCTSQLAKTIISKVASWNHSGSDCFLCVISSKVQEADLGQEGNGVGFLQSVSNYFLEENCTTLAGKPKIFITMDLTVQNSKTKESDGSSSSEFGPDVTNRLLTLPNDFLIVSYIEKERPDHTPFKMFENTLASALRKMSAKMEFVYILRTVNIQLSACVYSQELYLVPRSRVSYLSTLKRRLHLTKKTF